MIIHMMIDYKHSYKLYMNTIYKSGTTNLETVRNFEAMSNKFNVETICKRVYLKVSGLAA
jgi:hypothetical protein